MLIFISLFILIEIILLVLAVVCQKLIFTILWMVVSVLADIGIALILILLVFI